jgi:hypothetical protein
MSQETMNFSLDTDRFAEINGVKGQTVRKRYCETGSYYGIVPLKLASRRLMWPSKQATAPEQQAKQAA